MTLMTLGIMIRILSSLERGGEIFFRVLRKLSGSGGRTIRMGGEWETEPGLYIIGSERVCLLGQAR